MKYGVMRILLILMLAVVVAAPAAAQEKKKGRKGAGKKGEQQVQAVAAIKKQLASLDLSAEQTAKLEKLFAEAAPKLTAAQQKLNGLLTAEQRKAQTEARKKASAEGKKQKELQAAIEAALKLAPEKLAEMQKVQAESRELRTALNKSVLAILTPEQRTKVSLTVGRRGEGQKAKTGKRKKQAGGEAGK